MIGYKTEFLEIIESAGRNPKNRSRLWKCKCRCGNFTIIDTNSIKARRIISCGCSRKGNNLGNKFGFKHGLTKHGERAHPLYDLRNRILTRCYNAKPSDYPYYQGKGITVSDEWIKDPWAFHNWAIANGWQKGLCLDRIDPEGNYEPNNCQFLTISQNLKKMHREKNKNSPATKIKKEKLLYCFKCKCSAKSSAECKIN
jgi:hypothetical protein